MQQTTANKCVIDIFNIVRLQRQQSVRPTDRPSVFLCLVCSAVAGRWLMIRQMEDAATLVWLW